MMTSRTRIQRARQKGGRGPATRLGIAALVLAWFGTGPAGAPVAADPRDEARVYFAGAQIDTLDFEWRDVFPVAVARLERDHWVIQQADTADRRVVTRWKTMDHSLARLAMGDIKARCVVDLAPLSGGRTAIRLRAGLTGEGELDQNPLFGAAQAAYRKAGRKYLAGVRATLERSTATAAGEGAGADGRLNP